MSTKTTFKRIALVTVAALGFGVLTSVPSNAAASAVDFQVSALGIGSQLTGETATATSVVATLSYGTDAATDSITVTATLISAKNADGTTMTSGLVQPNLDVSETSGAQVQSPLATVVAKASAGGSAIAHNTPAIAVPTASSTFALVKLRVFMNAPTKAGTYVVRLTPALGTGGTAGTLNSATSKDVTITVTAAPADDLVATTATSILNIGETASATTDATVTAALTASATVAAATIKIGTLNKSALAAGESFTATIAGSGILGSGANSGDPITGPNASARVLIVKNGDVVQVFADGTSGVGTITISSLLGVVLATETVTFFGAATAITATAVTPVVGVSNSAGAILVTLKDAAGTIVSDVKSLRVTSSDATKITGSYAATTVAYNKTNGTAGAGYLVDLTAIAAGTANITVGTKATATATTGIEAAAVSIRVGSETPGSVSVTLDKSSYIPGEKATITVVLKDATGLTLADRTYTSIFAAGGITASYSLGAGSDTTTATSVDGFASGVKTFSVYMPISESDVKFSWTSGSVAAAAGTGLPTAAQAVAGSITVAVASNSGAAASAAAEEATAAANDATDAALSAAEAAEAATAMAQEAVDAVAELSAEVTKLFAALRAQITTLTNLIVKIQKKVKA